MWNVSSSLIENLKFVLFSQDAEDVEVAEVVAEEEGVARAITKAVNGIEIEVVMETEMIGSVILTIDIRANTTMIEVILSVKRSDFQDDSFTATLSVLSPFSPLISPVHCQCFSSIMNLVNSTFSNFLI